MLVGDVYGLAKLFNCTFKTSKTTKNMVGPLELLEKPQVVVYVVVVVVYAPSVEADTVNALVIS